MVEDGTVCAARGGATSAMIRAPIIRAAVVLCHPPAPEKNEARRDDSRSTVRHRGGSHPP